MPDQGIGFYARVSSDEQRERETIENQVAFAKRYFELHGIECTKWYLDDGVRGVIPLEERSKGREILDDADSGELKILYIYNMKRLGRATRITLNAFYELNEKRNVIIKSMTEPFDTETSAGRYFATNLAALATLDREYIMENLQQGMDRAARNGRWLGGIIPFGYYGDGDHCLQIYEPDAMIIRTIFGLIVKHRFSTYKVADHLNMMNILPISMAPGRGKRKKKQAAVWKPGRIRNLVHEPCYKGITYHCENSKIPDRETVERPVPAIVTEEEWNQAHEILKANKRFSDRNRKWGYLLSGMIHCALCGLNYIGTTNVVKGKYAYSYYRCSGKNNYQPPFPGNEKCKNNYIKQEKVEDDVWDMCLRYIENPNDSTLRQLSESPKRFDVEGEMDALNRSLREKDSEKERILILYRKQLITDDDVEHQLDQIGVERKTIENRLRELRAESRQEQKNRELRDNMTTLLRELKKKVRNNPSWNDKREIVRQLVKDIIVYPGKVVKVKFFFYPNEP